MDYERLIALNRFTRSDIESLTGKRPEHQSVISVGNTLAVRQLKQNIINKIPTVIRGFGKLTTVLSVCDELDLEYLYSSDGSLFDQLPFFNDRYVYIVRDPDVRTKLLKEYINTPIALCILDSGMTAYSHNIINLRAVTSADKQHYLDLKGYEMIGFDGDLTEQREEQLVAKHLRYGNVSPLPIYTHRWIARAFPNNLNILEICNLAAQTDNPVYYESLLRLIRYRKSIKLVYPKWLKRK